MFINGVQCDTCCKIHNKNVHSCPWPKEWISLQQDQQELHFCSIHCLSDWVQKQILIPIEVKQVENAEVIDNSSHMKRGEFKVTKEDCDRWRDL